MAMRFGVISGNQWNIALFGAGHVIQPWWFHHLRMKCQIYCVDPRQKLAGQNAILSKP